MEMQITKRIFRTCVIYLNDFFCKTYHIETLKSIKQNQISGTLSKKLSKIAYIANLMFFKPQTDEFAPQQILIMLFTLINILLSNMNDMYL